MFMFSTTGFLPSPYIYEPALKALQRKGQRKSLCASVVAVYSRDDDEEEALPPKYKYFYFFPPRQTCQASHHPCTETTEERQKQSCGNLK